MKKAVIVGASSGIGEALARRMAADGWHLGLTARRLERLQELAESLPGDHEAMRMDVADTEAAMGDLTALLEKMSPVDVVVLNAGVGLGNYKLFWEREETTIDINVKGFAATANSAFQFFVNQGSGQIVGMSSVGQARGGAFNPAYNASKAFMSNYLEGLRCASYKRKLGIAVTDVRPGFVDTDMTRGQKGMFWVAPVEVAAKQIYSAIQSRRPRVYITRRWRLIACLLALLPDALYRKM